MTGLVLEGGGARGAYQVGAIKALKKRGINIDGVVGTSIGSINAAFVCSDECDKMEKIWKSTTTYDLLGIDNELIEEIANKKINKKVIFNTLKTTKEILKNLGIDTKRLKKILNENINEEKIRKSNIEFGLVTYNISDRKPEKLFKEDIPNGKIVEHLIASSYLPIFKSEKIIDNKYYFDGGIYDNLPISMLLKKNYKTIYAIRTNALGKVKKNEIKKEQNIIYITPREKLGNILVFSPEKNKRNIKLGYFDALRAIDKLDGYKYYLKSRDLNYFDNILKNVTPYQISVLKRKFKTDNKKIITIKILEEVAKEKYLNVYKIYNLPLLIIKLKLLVKENDKYYNFIRKLKIMF